MDEPKINEPKKIRGRPKGTFKENNKTDEKDYYNKRYHATNTFMRCEDCLCVFRKKSLRKHLTTKIHIEGMKMKEKGI